METNLFYSEGFVEEYHRAVQVFWTKGEVSLLVSLFDPLILK
jgi:hypothetical protein